LNSVKNVTGVKIVLKSVREMKKYELEDLIDKVSKVPAIKEEMYEIDRLIKSRGHSVLRLPPYNWLDSYNNRHVVESLNLTISPVFTAT